MEQFREQTPKTEQPAWSILDGEFISSEDFPDKLIIQKFRKSLENYNNREIGQRVFYGEIIMYAVETCNPEILENKEALRSWGKEIIEATQYALQLSEPHRREDLKQLTESDIIASDVPVMQAVKEIQNKGLINSTERSILDAVIRTLHIKQRSKQAKSDKL